MVAIPERKLKESYALYCDEMKLKKESWNSIFDYSSVFGYSVISGAMFMDEGENLEVSSNTARTIEWVTGPHSGTMLKVLKCKRLSGTGKIKTALTKIGHALFFSCHAIVMVFKALYR